MCDSLTAYPREIKSVRSQADVGKITEHISLDMTGHFVGLDIHRTSVDLNLGIDLLVHRFVRLTVKSDLGAQILRGQYDVYSGIVSAVSHDLLLIVLQNLRIVADTFDEQNAMAELAGEVIVDFCALCSRNQHSVQELRRKTEKDSKE